MPTTTTTLPFGSYTSFVNPDQWHLEFLMVSLVALFFLGLIGGLLAGRRY